MGEGGTPGKLDRRQFVVRSAQLGAGLTGLNLLSACGGGGGGGGGGEAGGKTQIRFWHQEAVPKRVEVFQKFIDKFNEENDDVEVVQESQGWDVVFAKLVSALKAGNAPDVMLSLPAMTMTFQSRGEIIPVDDLVEEFDGKYKYVESQLTPFKYKGSTWGIPMWGMTFLWHYRNDALEEAGISKVPETWPEWLEACAAMKTDDKIGIVIPANKNLFTTESLYTLMISADAHVYGPDGDIVFKSPETVETLAFYKEMVAKAGPPDATSYDWGIFEQVLLRGVAMSANNFSSWREAMDETEFGDQWGATQQPMKPGGVRGQIHYPNNLMIFKKAEQKKEAIGRFAEFLLRPENNGEWLATMQPTLYLPITEEAQKAESFWNHPVISEHREMVEKQLEVLPDGQLYGFRFPDAYNASVGELEGSGVLGEIVQRMVVENMEPEAAAEWGQKRLEEVLKV